MGRAGASRREPPVCLASASGSFTDMLGASICTFVSPEQMLTGCVSRGVCPGVHVQGCSLGLTLENLTDLLLFILPICVSLLALHFMMKC